MLMQIAVENAPLGEIDLLCTEIHRVPPGGYCVSHCLDVIFIFVTDLSDNLSLTNMCRNSITHTNTNNNNVMRLNLHIYTEEVFYYFSVVSQHSYLRVKKTAS